MKWGTTFGCTKLALPLQFPWLIILLWPFLYFLVVRMQDCSLANLATDLLADPLFGFWHTFSMCLIIPQLKHATSTARPSLRFMDPLGCECFPYLQQSLAYCWVGDILTFWDCCCWSDLCTLDIVTWCMVLQRLGVAGQSFLGWPASQIFAIMLWGSQFLSIFYFDVSYWQALPSFKLCHIFLAKFYQWYHKVNWDWHSNQQQMVLGLGWNQNRMSITQDVMCSGAASQLLIATYIHSVQLHMCISMQICRSTSQQCHLTKISPLITLPATIHRQATF